MVLPKMLWSVPALEPAIWHVQDYPVTRHIPSIRAEDDRFVIVS
jgi:hypothetical protein